MADAADLNSAARKGVRVRISAPAPNWVAPVMDALIRPAIHEDRDIVETPACHVYSPPMEDEHKEPESASELLADWRSAERDTVSAQRAERVAALALAAAEAAEGAASEVEAAASAATAAVELARSAAQRARAAARLAAEAAQMFFATAEGDEARATQDVQEAEAAETAARDAFHRAQNDGFPKT